jgi:hypothetical protein
MSHDLLHPRPVIIVHLDTAPGAGLTACSGQPFRNAEPHEWPDVPRTLCPLCHHTTGGQR